MKIEPTVARAAYAALLRKEGRTDLADVQQQILERADARVGRSWSLALRMKDAPAAAEAQRQGLIPPGELEPMLARALVQARSFHYLK